ncbi:MAG: phenylacetic acid degradation bifunctional protein PaaZ, partial [Candidatus Accumulibacter sp.]|nr:phenylacetic acid degradation bifunctional protein PaaZ [Accumulibacter sp.]
MGHIPTLQSLIAGRWHGAASHTPLHSALDSTLIYHTHAEKIDFDEALTFARKTGVKALMRQTFQERAAALKALALYLMERKEELYAISHLTGATRQDSWVDVEGGIGTLFAYASMGSRELPSSNVLHEGPAIALGKRGGFAGTHILVPRGGVAVHINAFNFPIWGLLEKFAPSFLAAMPCIAKPATATSYLTHAVVKMMVDSNLLPDGALQLVIGSTGDLLDRLGGFDAVTFTGSADTAAMLRANGNLIRASVPFTAEADSLNCAVLAPDVLPSDPEFDLFIKEVAREMTGKAGQKCTAIRRVIVPEALVDAVGERLRERLAKITVGDPNVEGVRMGALASMDQHRDVSARVELLARGNEVLFGARDGFKPVGENVASGAFFSPTLLLCRNAMVNDAVHDVEAFGPVSTLMTYTDIDEALELAARGKGSLVTTLATKDPALAAYAVPIVAASHGRVLILDREAAVDSTGHGSPLPQLKHGGPGRAGGGEELGGIRAVKHFLQRAAVQGSPTMLGAVTGEYVRGGAVKESDLHPFRRHFEDLEVGHSLLTHRRTVSEADIVNFGGVSGDYFYMHFDAIAARDTQFGQRIAHGYFVLSAAAGLFVSPAPG